MLAKSHSCSSTPDLTYGIGEGFPVAVCMVAAVVAPVVAAVVAVVVALDALFAAAATGRPSVALLHSPVVEQSWRSPPCVPELSHRGHSTKIRGSLCRRRQRCCISGACRHGSRIEGSLGSRTSRERTTRSTKCGSRNDQRCISEVEAVALSNL